MHGNGDRDFVESPINQALPYTLVHFGISSHGAPTTLQAEELNCLQGNWIKTYAEVQAGLFGDQNNN